MESSETAISADRSRSGWCGSPGLAGLALIVLDIGAGRIPVGNLPLRFFFGNSVMLLALPHQALAFTGDHFQIIVGELAPLLAYRSFHLFPLTLGLLPIHHTSPC